VPIGLVLEIGTFWKSRLNDKIICKSGQWSDMINVLKKLETNECAFSVHNEDRVLMGTSAN
jgi:hypothetical protein